MKNKWPKRAPALLAAVALTASMFPTGALALEAERQDTAETVTAAVQQPPTPPIAVENVETGNTATPETAAEPETQLQEETVEQEESAIQTAETAALQQEPEAETAVQALAAEPDSLGKVWLTEIFPNDFDNRNKNEYGTTDDRFEYIELINTAETPVNLTKDYELVYGTKADNANPFAVQETDGSDVVLQPGEVTVVWNQRTNVKKPGTVEDFRSNYMIPDNVHIVISKQTDAIRRLETQILNVPAFKDLLISAETAEELCNSQTLLFIVDTHRTDMTVAPALIEQTERRVVIDHHRRSSDFIKKPLLTYTEPSSSSTSELVTELLHYYQEDVELEKIEATALYAGIIVDTKNFAVQTGVRTFDAAAYLRRSGADPEIVRELFSSDFTTVREKAAILSEARIVAGVAMASCPKGTKNTTIVAAQIADMLINIDNVNASFTFCELPDGNIGVSARSKGDINVQLVMEALGGGGHRTVAGAQLKERTVEEAQQDVMAALRDVINKNKEIEKE